MEGDKNCKDRYGYWGLAGKIDHGMRYFMKPHSIVVFGCDIHDYEEKPALLTRCWLNATPAKNNVLVCMERLPSLDPLYIQKYWVAINNNSWLPKNWNDIVKADSMIQTLVPTDKPYEG